MNYFVGTLALLLPLKYAESYTLVNNGCTNTENRSGCFYDVYCVGEIDQSIGTYILRQNPYIRHHAYGEQMYDESGMPLPGDTINECTPDDYIHYDSNSYNKIHLKFKDISTHIVDSEEVPQVSNRLNVYGGYQRSACNLIVHLDLSNNEYGSDGPNLKAMEYLSFLNLSSNYLTTARLYNPTELPALTDLDLSYNMINTIEVSSPVGVYRNLKRLNMSHNYLVDIPDAVLDSFTQLEMLDLSNNYIDTLSISTFEGIKKLNGLFLSHNRITDINYSFFRFSDLTVLDLSHNRIESLKLHDFEKLTKLETIDLSSNSLVNIESSVFCNMNSLVSLNLHDNKLKVMNRDTFANASSLKSIDISHNSFDVLPRGLFRGKFINYFAVDGNMLEGSLTSGTFEGLGYVSSLDLSYQHLTTIEDNAFLGLGNIKSLLLNNNKIQSLTKNCFRGLRNVNTLDLSHNNITDINFDAQDLVNLRSIVLSYNFLTQIKHENFQGLHLLQFLDLSNNKISKLESNSFKSLRDLVNFEVSNNPLTGSLEERTFDGLNSLPSLVISCTQLTTVKNGSFIGMTQLKELNMSQSKINELQYNAFINTGAIEEIDLSYNQLRVFDINSTELINLRVLLLHKNLLKTISQITFLELSRLTTLNLGHNNIKDIDYKAFESQKDLVHLDLSYNLDITFNDSFISENTNLRNLFLSGIRSGVSFTQIVDTQLTDLEVCYSGLSNITAINLRGLSRLENVKLSNNDVVRLDVGAFSNVTQLKHLDMSCNKLTFIQPGVFKDNIRLHSLNISHNSLTTISYGIFRGLIYLNTLDMSYNSITSLESERFYEVRSLSTLIVDHNKIDSLNAEDFVGTSLTTLSIGGNPLPCEILVNFKKNSVSFVVTAIKIDEHTNENVDGVTCNMNGYTYKKKSNTSNFDESARILIDIRDLLTKMTQQQPVSTSNTSNDKGTKFGLLLFTLFTVASSESCQLTLLGDCVMNFTCNNTLEEFEKINEHDCVKNPEKLKTTNITLQIENVIMDEANLAKFDSMDNKVQLHITELKLTNGELKVVPAAIKKMTQITSINLSNNRIEKISDSEFENLKELKILDLSYNKMRSIDILKLKIKQLERIYFTNNEIAHLVKSESTDKDSTITDIDLSHNLIEIIPDGYFDIFTKLEKLNLNHNKIESIDINKITNKDLKTINISDNKINKLLNSKTIYENSGVSRIDLSHNQIINIPDYYFKKFKNLEILNLSHNSINVLDKKNFYALESLQKLYLSNNKLSDINYIFQRLESLKELEIDNNEIQEISPEAFQTTFKLTNLNLAANHLKSDVTSALKPLSLLTDLNLSKNELTIISKTSFKENNNLTRLDLSDNKIHTIEPDAFKHKNITEFYFTNNKLTGSLQQNMFDGLFPTVLDLSHGEITEIGPSCFSNMTTLKELRLNNNAIKNIGFSAFVNNSALEYLDISYNNLSEINFKTDDLQKLRTFNASHNDIANCKTGVFKNFIGLVNLNLAFNQIKEVEIKTFEHLTQLEILDLHKNPLEKIYTNSPEGLKKLKELYIHETYLTFIDDKMFSGMENLKYLDASFDKITKVDKNAFKDNKNIEKLLLNNNEITDLSEVLNVIIELRTVNLSHNNIQIVDSKTFHSLSKLETVDLSFNENLRLEKPFDNLPSLRKVNLKKAEVVNFENIKNSAISELDLSFCGITDVNAIHLNNLNKIKTLNLCDNNIRFINNNSFKDMTLLEKLDLCHNDIEKIEPLSFNYSKQLKELDLSRNKLRMIHYGTFNSLNKLQTLNLSYNALESFPPGNLPENITNFKLILDDNSINSLDTIGFYVKNASSMHLSIGGNSIPCTEIREARSTHGELHLTALKLVKTEKPENFEGITCSSSDDKAEPTKSTLPTSYETNNAELLKWLKNITESLSNINQHTTNTTEKLNQRFGDNHEGGIFHLNSTDFENNKEFFDNMTKWMKAVNKSLYNNNQHFGEHHDFQSNSTATLTETDRKSMEMLLENVNNLMKTYNASLSTKQTNDSEILTNQLNTIVTQVDKSLNRIDGVNKKLGATQTEDKTTKTLAYISAIGVMVLTTMLIVKCILNYKKSNSKV